MPLVRGLLRPAPWHSEALQGVGVRTWGTSAAVMGRSPGVAGAACSLYSFSVRAMVMRGCGRNRQTRVIKRGGLLEQQLLLLQHTFRHLEKDQEQALGWAPKDQRP